MKVICLKDIGKTNDANGDCMFDRMNLLLFKYNQCHKKGKEK